MTSIDKRTVATSLNETRESIVFDIINGIAVENELLSKNFTASPDIIRSLTSVIREKINPVKITRKGGLKEKYDFLAIDSKGNEHHIELKCAETGLSDTEATNIATRPWLKTAQFAQGQLRGPDNEHLGKCGQTMMSEWFSQAIQPFVAEYEALLPDACQMMTEDEYMKAMYDIKAKEKGDKTPGYAFINALRDDTTLKSKIATKWRNFQNIYLQTFKPDDDDILDLVKKRIDVKDWWICITKDSAQLIEGFVVDEVKFVRSKLNKSRVHTYEMVMRGKHTNRITRVPLELRFNWKNGGQGVQNINFQLM